jgi:hypothetical protein
MRAIIFLSISIFCVLMICSCSGLETDYGSIAGTVFFNDEETRVGNAWVRLLDSETSSVVAEIQVDEEARFFMYALEGSYLLVASTAQNGSYTGSGQAFQVYPHQTSRIFFAIADSPPTN